MNDSIHTTKRTLEQALQNSERRYRRLFESSKDGILILDADTGKIVDANPFLLQLLGYSYEALCGKHIWQLGAFKDIAASKDAFKTLQDNDYIRYEDLPLQTLDGRFIAVEFVSNVYLVDHTKVIQCSIRDITGRKATEERLEQAHRQLVDAKDVVDRVVEERTFELKEAYENLRAQTEERKKAEGQLHQAQKMEAIGTLAGGIAHDFNNILAGIIGFTEMVLEDINPDGPEYKRLGLALKGANRGRELVRQILTFSRQTAPDRKPLALGQVVEEGLKLLRPTLPSTIEIVSKSVTNDDIVLADPVQMHQILMNLCTNAAHAMRDKGGRLDISISKAGFTGANPAPFPEMTPGEYVMLEVRDTGCGIEPEVLERIFDPFFTTKQQGEGTGLGLSVAHGIIKSHGGYVTVESKPGKGTVFQIYLPTVKEQKLSKDEAALAETGGKECILIVDDEDILIELNKQRLSKLGYDVVATTSSTEALEYFRKEPDRFDLVITDHTMPNLTGMDLAAELLKIRATIPIILCTGHSETVSPEQAKESGIRAFLMKPLAKQELATAIRRVLNTKMEK